MQASASSPQKDYRLLIYFILAWLAVNAVQAWLTGLDGDETYYWIYSRQLQWGYFDHPPMVALSIKLGELFGHGHLYTRAGAILFSALTIYFGYKALPERLKDAKWYTLVFSSVLIFHIYSFVTTPDSPLLFFTALFFYAYKLYLEKDDFFRTLLLAAAIAGMIYSKYHGILPVFFTFVSNPKLVLKRSAWIVVVLVIASFIPHLWWQYANGWPTVRYHLFERSQGSYKIEKTTNYILGLLLIFGPFTTLVAFIFFFKKRWKADMYFRAHLFTFFGVLIFFLVSSFKKNIEPHWTLTAGISFVVLVLDLVEKSSQKFKRIFVWLAGANLILIVFARLLLAVPGSPAKNIDRFQVQIYSHSWADSLYKKAAGTPLVFVDNYTYPSVYQYYHPDQPATCYSTVYYRKNNYNFQSQAGFNNRMVYTVRGIRIAGTDVEVKSPYVPTFLHPVDSFKAINGLKISWLNRTGRISKGQHIRAVLELSNPLGYSISGNNLYLNYTFFRSKSDFKTSENIPVEEVSLPAGYKNVRELELKIPESPGKYKLIFSFDQPFLGPGFASPVYELEIQ